MPRNATTGVYTRVSNSFSQPVDGTVIEPVDADAFFDDLQDGLNSLPAELSDRSVKNPAYGAVGDGAANDTAAIQAALAALAPGLVYFPTGTYSCAHIDVPSGVTLLGDGIGKTIIQCRSAPASGTDWWYASTVTDVEISGITFDGNDFLDDLNSGHFPNVVPCIYFVGGSGINIHDCEFIGWDTCGLLANTAHGITVRDCTVTRATPNAGYLVTPDGSGTDGVISSASASFTSASANFQVGDQNKMIIIEGAGAAGGRLVAMILTRNSATNVTLNRTALTTVASGGVYRFGGTAVGNYGIFLGGTGAVDADNLYDFLVDGCSLTNCNVITSGHDGAVTDNRITGFAFGNGIGNNGLASNFNITINGNVITAGNLSQDTAGAGPTCIENWAYDSVISNNTCTEAFAAGISHAGKNCVVSGNVCNNNGQGFNIIGASGFAGIFAHYQSADLNANGSLIIGNKCTDTQVSKTQEYGYLENSGLATPNGSDVNPIWNDFSGNRTGDVSLQTMTRGVNFNSIATLDAAAGFTGGFHQLINSLGLANNNFNLFIAAGGTLSGSNKTFTITTNNANRTLDLSGNVTFGGQFLLSGGSALTLTTTGTTSATLPAGTYTLLPSHKLQVNLSTAQSVSSGVKTKIQFNTEVADQDGWYDNATNYRYTPLLAGKYLVTVNVSVSGTTVSSICLGMIYKNGSEYAEAVGIPSATNGSASCTAIVDMNGSTDFIEGWGRVTAVSGAQFDGGTAPIFTWMTISYVGP